MDHSQTNEELINVTDNDIDYSADESIVSADDDRSRSSLQDRLDEDIEPYIKYTKMSRRMAKKMKDLSEEDQQVLRLKVNSRERKRMHDLNSALDGLREVMPYANGPSVRKMSKIATLLLARNYIVMLTSSLEEMKKLVSDIYQHHPPSVRHPLNPITPTTPAAPLPIIPSPPTTSTLVAPSLPAPSLPTFSNLALRSSVESLSLPSKESSSFFPRLPHSLHPGGHPGVSHISRWQIPCSCTQCFTGVSPYVTHGLPKFHSVSQPSLQK